MMGRLCIRIGATSGLAAALAVAFAKTQPCCVPAPAPGIWDYVLAGWIAGGVVALLVVLFQHLVLKQPLLMLIALAIWIVLFVGAICGVIGGLAPNYIVAMVAGLLVGGILGWFLCMLCGRFGAWSRG